MPFPSASDPIIRLLSLGPVAIHAPWADYRQTGITPAHLPRLVELLTSDDAPETRRIEDDLLEWAPVHVWRCLAQFRAPDAIEPLLSLLDEPDALADELLAHDIPHIFGHFGPPAIEGLRHVLDDPQRTFIQRKFAAASLKEIALREDASRAVVCGALADALAPDDPNADDLNAVLAHDLAQLRAESALPAIEAAFAAGNVNLALTDWARVRSLIPAADPHPEWHFDAQRDAIARRTREALVRSIAPASRPATTPRADRRKADRKPRRRR